MDTKFLEAWLRLTAEALKGTEEARKALWNLGEAPPSQAAVDRWLSNWMPQAGAWKVSDLQDQVEEAWKSVGVVPRYRYLQLLEKYEELRGRLEEAESTVKNLRELLAQKGREQEARGAIDKWDESTRKTLENQADWARTWTEAFFGKQPDEPEKK